MSLFLSEDLQYVLIGSKDKNARLYSTDFSIWNLNEKDYESVRRQV